LVEDQTLESANDKMFLTDNTYLQWDIKPYLPSTILEGDRNKSGQTLKCKNYPEIEHDLSDFRPDFWMNKKGFGFGQRRTWRPGVK